MNALRGVGERDRLQRGVRDRPQSVSRGASATRDLHATGDGDEEHGEGVDISVCCDFAVAARLNQATSIFGGQALEDVMLTARISRGDGEQRLSQDTICLGHRVTGVARLGPAQ